MALVDTAPALAERRPAQSFFSPAIDFLCLGGGSLLLLPVLAFVVPDSADASALFVAMLLSNVVNHPHFANSYQIFYRSFRTVAYGPDIDRALRIRYMVAGIVVPMLIALFFVVALSLRDPRILGYAGNAMTFFVGWHYVKQGYGMLMVDAAMKKSYFNDAQKKALLWNAYVGWITAWLYVNNAIAERNLWGLAYSTFDVPNLLLVCGILALTATSIWSILALIRHSRVHGGRAPINGIAAYIASIYPWLFFTFEPVVGVLIPCMHSLQYLIVVWRYQLNVEEGKSDAARPASVATLSHFNLRLATQRFIGFLTRGVVLGAIGFWVLPILLSQFMPYDRELYGHHLFFFIFIIFINIHHYFIDNAMWRKENPHTLKHLFAQR
jgi:hypothetical protein